MSNNALSVATATKAATPLTPGVPYLLQNALSGTMLDMAFTDFRTVHGWKKHGKLNQQWELVPSAGQGYAIRCIRRSKVEGNPMYLTVGQGVVEGGTIVPSPYPVNWNVEKTGKSIRISWPDSKLVITVTDGTSKEKGNKIQLVPLKSDDPAQLWHYTITQRALLVDQK